MIDLNDYQYYENRELSWLEFNQRVLDEAMNVENPLFERIKFLAIVSSNLDEFFMVRVASLKEVVNAGYEKPDFSGMVPKEQLKAIADRTHLMIEEQMVHYARAIVPQLKRHGLHIMSFDELEKDQMSFVEDFFTDVIYPVLTPLAVDSGRPFPLIYNKSLNLGVILEGDEEELFAVVQVPSVLQRYIPLPNGMDTTIKSYILLEDIIEAYIDRLFVGRHVLSVAPFRITRNSDLSLDEEEAEDLLLEIEKSIKKRKWGQVIRLEIRDGVDERLLGHLTKPMGIGKKETYFVKGPIDLTYLMKLYGVKGFDHLKYDVFIPQQPHDLLGEEDMFEAIKKKDIFLFHPFESFQPVIDLVTQAANDPNVLAIKQTLYRVSGQSPIVKALERAADNGKQVTVLVELKARFDEESNIAWARRLEEAGCHVIYGLVGLKTHSKVTLIVRQEDDGIKRYVHLGTGNYNDITARFYTDTGLMTCNEKIGTDTTAIFNTLSGYSDPPKLHKITMAPTGLRDKFCDLIRREQRFAEEGREARIIVKMNSFCDQELIKVIYEAAMAGVKIELIVRGICSLKTGIVGVSENITVRSIVGKYLEHSRIFYFYANGDEEVYMSSADWMPRNLNRRVELLFPIEEETIKRRVIDMLDVILSDVVKAKIKSYLGAYYKIDGRGKPSINARVVFERRAIESVIDYKEETDKDIFVPIYGNEG